MGFRGGLHDRWILHGAPWLVASLPEPLAWPICRGLSRLRHMYPEPVQGAVRIAPRYLPIDDMDAFRRDLRSGWLMDAADLVHSRRHPTDRLPADVDVEGRWPVRGGFLAASFHYGNGLSILRHLRATGHDSVFVSGRFDAADFATCPVRYRYGRARMAEVERIGGLPIAYRPGVRGQLLAALADGAAVVGLVDVPPRLAPRGQCPVHLLGQPASLPLGLFELAAEAGVPVVPCWVEPDFRSGRRRLVIGEALSPASPREVAAAMATLLDRLLRAQPAAWMFWNEWPGWLADAAALHGAAFQSGAAEGRLQGSEPVAGTSP